MTKNPSYHSPIHYAELWIPDYQEFQSDISLVRHPGDPPPRQTCLEHSELGMPSTGVGREGGVTPRCLWRHSEHEAVRPGRYTDCHLVKHKPVLLLGSLGGSAHYKSEITFSFLEAKTKQSETDNASSGFLLLPSLWKTAQAPRQIVPICPPAYRPPAVR